MSNPLIVNDKNRERRIIASGKTSPVTFCIYWCGPSKMMTSTIRELAQDTKTGSQWPAWTWTTTWAWLSATACSP